MAEYAWQLGAVGLLVLLNAVFAGSEIALLSLREGQLRRLEERGSTGQTLAQLARDPNRFLATVQIGITLAGFLASATAAVTLATPVASALSFLGAAAEPVAVSLVTAVLAFLTLVLGELAPKRLAMQRAERWGLLAARPLSGLATLSRPVVWLLSHATDLTVRVLGGDPDQARAHVTSEEIRDLVLSHRLFTTAQQQIIAGALDVSQRMVRDVLTPRPDVAAIRSDSTVEEGIAALAASGHTRAPVYDETLDDAQRIVALLDLVGATGTVDDHATEAIALPEVVPVVTALRTLQRAWEQMALVISEYGEVEGVVTVEDLVEEIVGEIHDEFDIDVRRVKRHGDTLRMAGSFPVHDLEDLDVDLPDGDYVTVAGLILDHLGRLPQAGESIVVGGWELVIETVSGRRIREVSLHPAPTDESEQLP